MKKKELLARIETLEHVMKQIALFRSQTDEYLKNVIANMTGKVWPPEPKITNGMLSQIKYHWGYQKTEPIGPPGTLGPEGKDIPAERAGALQILNERVRQQTEEGYTIDEDRTGELIYAAVAYIFKDQSYWPQSWDTYMFKPKSTKENLVKAGALIAAAIDKIEKEENQ